MLGEVIVFLAVTFTVKRSRPAVVRLDKSPPTLSFPSGHTAAALALYGGVAVLLLFIYGRNWKTIILSVILLSLPILVGISRLYRGMHFPTDVLAGALGGGVWMAFVISIMIPKSLRPEYVRDRSKALQ
jgi:undecaprenyl-diphosphatase